MHMLSFIFLQIKKNHSRNSAFMSVLQLFSTSTSLVYLLSPVKLLAQRLEKMFSKQKKKFHNCLTIDFVIKQNVLIMTIPRLPRHLLVLGFKLGLPLQYIILICAILGNTNYLYIKIWPCLIS